MGQSCAIARMVQGTVNTLPWKGIIASAALYFIDRHVHEGRGDKVAFREYPNGWVLSYGMMAATSDKIFGAFGQVGIAREELAAMLVLDYLGFLQIFWGAIKAGVVPMPLNTLLAAPVYDAILRDRRASILFILGGLYATVKPVLADNPYLSQ